MVVVRLGLNVMATAALILGTVAVLVEVIPGGCAAARLWQSPWG